MTLDSESSPYCVSCGGQLDRLLKCAGCFVVSYCSRTCQKMHCGKHKLYCEAIQFVAMGNKGKNVPPQNINVCELKGKIHGVSPNTKNTIIKDVGESCLVDCTVEGKSTNVLWDTGAQVSLIDKKWLSNNFPNILVRPINELSEGGSEIVSANGTRIPFEGWVELDIVIGNWVRPGIMRGDNCVSITVPFLVASAIISGFNVIKHLVNGVSNGDRGSIIQTAIRNLKNDSYYCQTCCG